MEAFTPHPRDLGLDVTLRDFAADQVVFGRYRLRKVLGRGGMGIVWQASDLRLEREVALKFLPDTVTFNGEALDNLKRETRRSLMLTHPHIVRIYDLVQDETWACISMEYVDGSPLSWLKVTRPARCFEVVEIRNWVRQLIEGLDYAHKRAKVIHRDLKPGNLMVNEAGELKIADFGISRTLTDSRGQVSSPADSSGTLAYMSPQQARGQMPVVTDDVYSLGATLYDLLSGKPPFFSGNIAYQVEEIEPPSLAQRRAELGASPAPVAQAWEETIAACLAKDPGRRPASANEVGRRLLPESFGGAPDIRTTVSSAPPKAPPPEPENVRHRTLLWPWLLLALAGLMLVALAIGVGRWFLDHSTASPAVASTPVMQPAETPAAAPPKAAAPVTTPAPVTMSPVAPVASPAPAPAPATVASTPTPSSADNLEAFRPGDYVCQSPRGELSVTGPFPADDHRQTWVCTGAVNGTWTTGPAAGHPQLTALPKDAILPKGWTFGLSTTGDLLAVRQLDDKLVLMQPTETRDQWDRVVYVEQGSSQRIFEQKPTGNP